MPYRSFRPRYFLGAQAWLIEIIFQKNVSVFIYFCSYLPIYLPMFVYPYTPIHVSNFLSGKYSLHAQIKAKQILY